MVLNPNSTVCLESPSIPSEATIYNPGKVTMMWVIVAVDSVFTFACVFVFWYFQRTHRYEHLRLRPVILVVFLALMNGERFLS